jgi:2-methylisocitrate lyase-like PEP mutase family enzyme
VIRLSAATHSVTSSDYRRLRALLEADEVLELPVVCDPLGARLAAEHSFEAVTLSGYAIGAHLPDGEILTADRIEAVVRRVSTAAGLPVLLDADAGLSPAVDLPRAVARLTTAGASGILFSSQYLPAAVPIDAATARAGSHADLMARVSAVAGMDVVVAARLDVDLDPYEEVVRRGRELMTAGASTLLVSSGSDATLRSIGRDLAGASLVHSADPALPCLPSEFSPARLQRWGYAGVANKYHQCRCPRMSLMSPAHPSPRISGLG